MSIRSYIIALASLTAASCATQSAESPPPGSATPGALTATTSAPPAASAPAAAPQPTGARGSIVGTVATNPWHSIKVGGVVYLEDGPRGLVTPPSATLDNHDMEFVPNVVAIAAGGSVIFTNTDPMVHNVFTPDGDKWNLGEIPPNGSVVKRFDTPGDSVILCNLHQSMRAYLEVAPSPYFARTSPEGTFVIKNVPPGTYHVTAWVPRLKKVTQTVTVGTDEATANFSLER